MVMGVVLVLVAAWVMWRGVRDYQQMQRLRREGRQVVGHVINHEVREGGGKAAIVAYTDEHGRHHQFTSPMAAGRPIVKLGEQVTVRYLAGDPASASMDERRENVRSVLLIVIIGIGFAAAGVTLIVKND